MDSSFSRVESVQIACIAPLTQDRAESGRGPIYSRKELRRSQLRGPSAAPRIAEVHRGSAQRGADSGLAAAPVRVRGVPGRWRHLLPPVAGATGGRAGRRGSGGGRGISAGVKFGQAIRPILETFEND